MNLALTECQIDHSHLPDFLHKGYLHSHLKAMRVRFDMFVTHLAMILSCSRPQYLRMESGENRFKDEQLELLSTISLP